MPTNPLPSVIYDHSSFTCEEHQFIWLTDGSPICQYVKKFHIELHDRIKILYRLSDFLNTIEYQKFIKNTTKIDYYNNTDYWDGVFRAIIFINQNNIKLKLNFESL